MDDVDAEIRVIQEAQARAPGVHEALRAVLRADRFVDVYASSWLDPYEPSRLVVGVTGDLAGVRDALADVADARFFAVEFVRHSRRTLDDVARRVAVEIGQRRLPLAWIETDVRWGRVDVGLFVRESEIPTDLVAAFDGEPVAWQSAVLDAATP